MAARARGTRTPLSRGEWSLMNVCWRLGKATARQVHEASAEGAHRDYRTTKTMLDRMATKGWLRVSRVGPVRLYAPAVPRSRALVREVRDFVDRVLGRSVAPLFVHLLDEDLSEEDLRALRELLERKTGERPRRGRKGR